MNAVDGEPPPAELRLKWMCQNFSSMPDSGGMNDQDFVLIRRMIVLNNVYNTVSKMRSLKGAAIHALSISDRQLVAWLRDEGVL